MQPHSHTLHLQKGVALCPCVYVYIFHVAFCHATMSLLPTFTKMRCNMVSMCLYLYFSCCVLSCNHVTTPYLYKSEVHHGFNVFIFLFFTLRSVIQPCHHSIHSSDDIQDNIQIQKWTCLWMSLTADTVCGMQRKIAFERCLVLYFYVN